MMSRIAKPRFCFVILIVLIVGSHTTTAQSENDETVFVEVNGPAKNYIMSYRAENPGANVLLESSVFSRSDISRDGNWVFVASFDSDDPSNPFKLDYAPRGQAVNNPSLSVSTWSISADSRYLFYTTRDANAEGPQETLNFLELANGKRVELFFAPLPTPEVTTQGSIVTTRAVRYMIYPMQGWTLGTQGQLAFYSLVNGGPRVMAIGGFFNLDLSHLDFTKSGSYDLPTRYDIARIAQRTLSGTLSPDGTKVAYMYMADGKDAPGSGIVVAAEAPSNSVAIYDLATGKTATFDSSQPDKAINNIQWMLDSSGLYYVETASSGGSNTSQLYTYDLAKRLSSSAGSEIVSGNSRLSGWRVCGSSLFYVLANSQNWQLYSAPLSASSEGKRLMTGSSLTYLLSCAPSTAWNTNSVESLPTPEPTKVALGLNVNVATLDLSGGDATTGAKLYTSLGCVACHISGAVGPNLEGLVTRTVNQRLKDSANAGKSVEQYIAQSIIEPRAYVVPGYPSGIMPPFGDQLTLQDLRDLIAYLETLK